MIREGKEKDKEKASLKLMTLGTPTNSYLQNTDKEKGHPWRWPPLQSKLQSPTFFKTLIITNYQVYDYMVMVKF